MNPFSPVHVEAKPRAAIGRSDEFIFSDRGSFLGLSYEGNSDPALCVDSGTVAY